MSENSNGFLCGDARFDELMERIQKTSVGKSVSASEWQEVIDFVEELAQNQLTDDRITREYECGRKDGVEQTQTRVKKAMDAIAAEYFTVREDAFARLIRDLKGKVMEALK